MKDKPFVLVVGTILLFLVLGTLGMTAQEKKEQAKVKEVAAAVKIKEAPKLSELESLNLDNLKKDAVIAQQRVQLVQVQFNQAQAEHRAKFEAFWAEVSRLRTKYQALEEDFTFDADALTFALKKQEEKKP